VTTTLVQGYCDPGDPYEIEDIVTGAGGNSSSVYLPGTCFDGVIDQ
jgi:hypothetical protein